MITRFHDCSNQDNRTHLSGGPVQNDVMRYLQKYAPRFGFEHTSLEDAEVVITNDTFPEEVSKAGKLLVKRMDGTVSYLPKVARNTAINEAAALADHVVFISKFSRASLLALYPEFRFKHGNRWIRKQGSSIACNEVDPEEFYPGQELRQQLLHLIAVATDWSRPEKRGCAIVSLARAHPKLQFHFVGKPDPSEAYPDNCHLHGYISDYVALRNLYHSMDAMVHLAWRDAAPKTVLQGLACNLPVFYAAGGGTSEFVGSKFGCATFGWRHEPDKIGCPFPDTTFSEHIDTLDMSLVLDDFKHFCSNWRSFRPESAMREHRQLFQDMLSGYFDALRDPLTTGRRLGMTDDDTWLLAPEEYYWQNMVGLRSRYTA